MKPHHEIFKMFAKQVSPLGFTQLKTTWWERRKDLILQKIHIHKFSFTTSFRVHAALHLVGFGKDVDWLNGMSSHDGWYEKKIMGLPISRYDFKYTESSASWPHAADNLFEFTKEVLVPWFERWSDFDRLKSAADSPLDGEQKAFLAQSENISKIN